MAVSAIGSTYPTGEQYSPTFWRTSQYRSYKEAQQFGGTYHGEDCYGYGAFVDAMCCAMAAAECLDAGAKDDLRVHVIVDGKDMGDFRLSDAR